MAATDCCNGNCMGGTCAVPDPPACRPAGEPCATGMDCCGGVCGPTTEGGPLGCALLSQCRVAGETCTAPTDCCTGQCSAGPGGSGSCQALPGPGCRPALEICKTSMDCCSGRCDNSVIDGVSRCAWAPGCRPVQERCASNADCCSGTCKMGPPGVGRCADMPAPMMMSHCPAVGEVCKKAMDCCPGESCSPVATGGSRCLPLTRSCVGDGYPCALSEECCGGHCLPDGTGALSCRSVYAPVGAPCTASDDCSSGAACLGTPGSLVCSPLDSSAPGVMCTGRGDACDPANPVCCAGTACSRVAGSTTACAPPTSPNAGP